MQSYTSGLVMLPLFVDNAVIAKGHEATQVQCGTEWQRSGAQEPVTWKGMR